MEGGRTGGVLTVAYQRQLKEGTVKDKWLGEINSKNLPPVMCLCDTICDLLEEGHSFKQILHMWTGPCTHIQTCTHAHAH